MTFNTLARRLKAGSALPALALAAISITGGAFLATPAAAQDYTSGAISGTIVDSAKKPIAGATVTLHSQAQGQTQTFTTSSKGAFNASGLAAGTYDISVSANGFDTYADTISIVAAQSNAIVLPLSKTGANDIVVTGSRVRQDFTKTTAGLNIDVTNLTKDVPVARSITGLILLAPTTIAGSPAFGTGNNAVPSIGGGSVAENAYYINGLNITNPDTYVASTRVPFDFYKTVDVQTSGYAAEFGRATGGVINATTKSGSNTPMMAIHGNFEPVFAQATGGILGLASKPTNIPKYTQNENESLTFEASGALIKDHLFVYGLVQPQVTNYQVAQPNSKYIERQKSTSPFYGGKVDAYLNPTQHLEFTFFDTTNNIHVARNKFTPTANNSDGTIGAPLSGADLRTGGFNWVGRYTGNVTDFFQISGAYGINKDANNTVPTDTSAYYITDRRTVTTGGVNSVISNQTFPQINIANTERKFWRVDGDLRFDAFGHHHIRFGVDNEDVSELKTTTDVGAQPVSYNYRNTYILATYERLGGAIKGNDRAFYLQDSWEPLLGLTINAGVRDDTFKQYNIAGQKYLDFKGNWAARAGFSYVPNGTSKFKFSGSYGRYFIPPAMNLGFRGHDDYFQEGFNYPAGYTAATFPIDPVSGLPLVNLGTANALGNKSCPESLAAAPGHPVNGTATCIVYGNNTQDPAFAKVAPGTKPTNEDEFALAASYQLTPLIKLGISGVYRKLNNVSEDSDLYYYLEVANGCFGANASSPSCVREADGNTYYIWNPHSGTQVVKDWVTGQNVTLTGLQFPKAKRTYKAVTLTLDRADDGKWSWHGSVTFARSRGNYEGTVKTDEGNTAQTDAGSTADFDYIGLTDNSYGRLPNDRAVTIKSYGAYHATKDITVGYGLQVASPLHGSCLGIYPETNVNDDGESQGYAAASYYCGTTPNAAGQYTVQAAAPRGTGYKSDWFTQLDLSFRYTVPGTKLVLRADVFNVLNKQAVLQRYDQHETAGNPQPGGTTVPDPLYLSPLYLQQPRYARFGFDWQF